MRDLCSNGTKTARVTVCKCKRFIHRTAGADRLQKNKDDVWNNKMPRNYKQQKGQVTLLKLFKEIHVILKLFTNEINCSS